MKRTTIMLPPDLKVRAAERAQQVGISLGELIRRSLELFLEHSPNLAAQDPLLADDAICDDDIPTDLSARHDAYLYGDGT